MNSDPVFLLKVLTGPHQGAELALHPGAYVLGSAEDCDIIFTDALIEPHHLRFELGKSKAKVVRIARSIFIDGKPLQGDQQEVAMFQFITAGSTYFTFGPTDQPWPPAVLGPLPPLQEETRKEAGPGGLAVASGEEKKSEPESRLSALPRKLALLGFIVFVSTGVISLMVLVWERPVAAPPPTHAQVMDKVEAALRQLGFGDHLKVEVQFGRVAVSGYVQSQEQVRELNQRLAPWSGQVTVLVVSDETLVADTREILTAFGSQLQVGPAPGGGVQISGFAGDSATWNRLKTVLQRDLPEFPRLDFQVLTGEEAAAKAAAVLDTYQLGKAIVLTPNMDGLVATGAIDPDQTDDWAKARQEIRQAIPQLPKIEDQVTTSATAAASGPSTDYIIDSIAVGPISWITLRNGRIYFTGALLPNGWAITSIFPDSIEVSRDGRTRLVKIGSSVMAEN